MKRVILLGLFMLQLWFGFGGSDAYAGDRHGGYRNVNPNECWGQYANSSACQAKREARTTKWRRVRTHDGTIYEEHHRASSSVGYYYWGGGRLVCDSLGDCLAIKGIEAAGRVLEAVINAGSVERAGKSLEKVSADVTRVRLAEINHGTLREVYAADRHSEGRIGLNTPDGGYDLEATRPRHGHVRSSAAKSRDSLRRCSGKVLAAHDVTYAQDYGPSVGIIETGKGTCFYGGR